MKKSQKLLLGRNIFAFIIIILFTIIIIHEKASSILLPKAEEKINTYFNENYNFLKGEVNKDKVKYENSKYSMTLKNKSNKHLYFKIYYKNKKTTDTYKKDYLEGKSILKYTKNKLEKEINTITNQKCSIEIISTLDKFTPKVQERIINEDNLLQLKFYNIEKELTINNWNTETITSEIVNFIEIFQNNNITPKSYTLIITDKKEITKSIKISNITDDFTKNNSKKEIINAIINDENKELLDKEKIEYTYLN
ncbi:MAG: hypothetical protein IJI22_01970 [Bacilli bacterium]|nr:hypothetical protein [Bacilli bacterium]